MRFWFISCIVHTVIFIFAVRFRKRYLREQHKKDMERRRNDKDYCIDRMHSFYRLIGGDPDGCLASLLDHGCIYLLTASVISGSLALLLWAAAQ